MVVLGYLRGFLADGCREVGVVRFAKGLAVPRVTDAPCPCAEFAGELANESTRTLSRDKRRVSLRDCSATRDNRMTRRDATRARGTIMHDLAKGKGQRGHAIALHPRNTQPSNLNTNSHDGTMFQCYRINKGRSAPAARITESSESET